MSRKPYFSVIMVTTGVLLLGLLFFFNYKEDSKSKPIIDQFRLYEVSLDSLFSVSYDIASTEELVFNDKIYFKDFINQQIIETNFIGDILNRYGNRGEGPGENLMIRGFNVDQNNYFTSDSRKNTLTKINFNGKIKYDFKLDFNVSSSVFIANDKVIVKGNTVENGITKISFNLIDPINRNVKNIDLNGIFPDEDFNDFLYDGHFINSLDGGAFYLTFYSNFLLKFNANGKLDYVNKVIYKVPKLELSVLGSAVFPASNDNPHFYSLSTDQNYLYVQSAIGDKKLDFDTMLVDLYKIGNGNYFSSIQIKKDKDGYFPNSIKIFENKLFLFYEQYFSVHQVFFK